jgi:hypothetical protein
MSSRLKSWLSHPAIGIAVVLLAALAAACLISRTPPASVNAADTKPAAAAEKAVVAAGPAAAKPGDAVAEKSGEASLPLKRVVLFSSGVGFFDHAGQVRDNAKVELKFKLKDINDLLKSMVVQDFDGGHVSTVGYGSNDPLEKRLSSFAVDLTSNPSLAKLLGQVRGERVEVDAPNKIVGTIVGLETRKQEIGKDRIIEADVLNLLTAEGLRSVTLESAGHIKLLNEKLDAELHKALAVLATAHATDKKTVTLDFRGEGKRRVAVSYVQETPIWKTSYRLVLEDEKPTLLQGWSIVENPTEEDWNDVRLTLVSGRPISFIMDLYQPIYIPRPVVGLELFASLHPQSYEQDLANKDMEFRKMAAAQPPMPMAPGMSGGGGFGLLAKQKSMRGAARGEGKGEGLAFDAAAEQEQAGEKPFNLRQGVQSVATAGKVGELFQYAIATPVTLSRHESAMLPIIQGDVQAEKVSIYNPAVQPKHPLAGLRLTNSTDLHLMQGPITVFDGGAYAGDAKIDDIPPHSQRLLSYALDLDTEVAPESKGQPEELVSVRIVKGTLITERKHKRTQEYTVKNSGRKPKKILIEYGLDPAWTLVSPKEPAEKTRDQYRFAVEAKPGVPAKLLVEEQRTDQQQVALTNLDDNTILYYIRAKEVSPKVKEALGEVIKRKQAIQEVAVKRGQVDQQIRTIGEEQARIRENMGKLDRDTDLYKRYVKKLSDQEDDIEKLRTQSKELLERETQLRKALDEYLVALDLS